MTVAFVNVKCTLNKPVLPCTI